MFKRGVLILGAGRNAIRFAPPLVITKAQIDVIVDTFRQALDALKG
jgi:4-aminobutyrate aminotransferase-like enzyme